MSTGRDFETVTATWVYPVDGEEYNVITTQAENMYKEYYLLSATPQRQYRLTCKDVSDTTFALIVAHWRSVSGTYYPFWWTTVPNYIDGGYGSGVSLWGRWVGKPKWEPKSRSWDVEMVFEQDPSREVV
jgi:hypothetical protein